MRKLIASILFLFLYMHTMAQNTDSVAQPNIQNIKIRFHLLGLLDAYDRHIPLGVEVPINVHWSAGTDFGYIFFSEYLYRSEKTSGFLIRPFIRNHRGKNRFLEARLHVKSVKYAVSDWVERGSGNNRYQQYMTTDFKKLVLGLDVLMGRELIITKDERFRAELFIGFGIRSKQQKLKEEGFPTNSIRFMVPEFIYPTVPAGARFTMLL